MTIKDWAGFCILMTLFASWLTHIVYCLSAAKYLLLLIGAMVFPVGIIHGLGIWLGLGW